MRFHLHHDVDQFRDRWYVEDTRMPRVIGGIGPDARPSNAASLTYSEATVIERALNILYGTGSRRP